MSNSPRIVIDAVPESVRAASSLVMVYAALHALLELVVNFERHRPWMGLWLAVSYGVMTLNVGMNLLMLKKWAYWVAMVVGILMLLRCVLGVLVFPFRASRGLPHSPVQLILFIAATVVLSQIVKRLALPESKRAFGI